MKTGWLRVVYIIGSENYSGRLLPNPIERWDLGKIKNNYGELAKFQVNATDFFR